MDKISECTHMKSAVPMGPPGQSGKQIVASPFWYVLPTIKFGMATPMEATQIPAIIANTFVAEIRGFNGWIIAIYLQAKQ